MMQTIIIYAFAAAVLGGIESPLGAVVGGLIVGVTVNLAGAYIPFVGGDLQLAVALAIIVVVGAATGSWISGVLTSFSRNAPAIDGSVSTVNTTLVFTSL